MSPREGASEPTRGRVSSQGGRVSPQLASLEKMNGRSHPEYLGGSTPGFLSGFALVFCRLS